MNTQPQAEQFLSLEPPAPRRRSPARLRLALLAAALLVATLAAMRYGPARLVQGETVRTADLVIELRGPGTLDALSQASIASRIQGRIEELRVDRNDHVAKGDLLARVSFDDLSGELAAARASAAASERAVSAVQADRSRAVAQLDKTRATHQRQVALIAKGVASVAGLEDALAARRQAEADVVHADRTIEQAEAERDAARARVVVAEAQWQDSMLRAPIDGVVVSRAHHPGEVLTPGTELLRIVDPASLILSTRLDESAIPAVRPGQAAAVVFAQASRPIPGHVLRLGREVDEETREFTLDIALDALPDYWALGQRGMATVAIDAHRQVLAVSSAFIARHDGRPGVWLAVAGRARWREVGLGATGGGRVEIRQGLAPGDVVLAPDGIYSLMPVRLRLVGDAS